MSRSARSDGALYAEPDAQLLEVPPFESSKSSSMHPAVSTAPDRRRSAVIGARRRAPRLSNILRISASIVKFLLFSVSHEVSRRNAPPGPPLVLTRRCCREWESAGPSARRRPAYLCRCSPPRSREISEPWMAGGVPGRTQDAECFSSAPEGPLFSYRKPITDRTAKIVPREMNGTASSNNGNSPAREANGRAVSSPGAAGGVS